MVSGILTLLATGSCVQIWTRMRKLTKAVHSREALSLHLKKAGTHCAPNPDKVSTHNLTFNHIGWAY